MDTNEQHPAVHVVPHPHHMKWWGDWKSKAEECVREVLEGGSRRVAMHEAIGKDSLEAPEDWDTLMDFCKTHGAGCHDLSRLYRAATMWLQAYAELEYKKSHG